MTLLVVGVVAAVVVVVTAAALFKASYWVAEPNEALLITGKRDRGSSADAQSLGFKVVTGGRAVVVPFLQRVRTLGLGIREVELDVDGPSRQGIKVHIQATVVFKIGDDTVSIQNAARRFLDKEDLMEAKAHNVFSGHLRSIIGGLRIEEIIGDRERLSEETRQSSAAEMQKMGLVIDSLQIHAVTDGSGYIANLAVPHTAAVSSAARVAQAEQERLAAEAEARSAARQAEARRTSSIEQAGYQAEIDRADAEAAQAGPLAEAIARQRVTAEETRAAELAADLAEKQLQATVRKPADAAAYQARTLAEGQRDSRTSAAQAAKQEVELKAAADAIRISTQARADADAQTLLAVAHQRTGEAEAAAQQARGLAGAASTRAQGLAEAETIEARARALASNPEAVIGQQLAQDYAQIVAAAAQAFGGVEHMTVLNGAEGVTQSLASLVSVAGSGLSVVRQLAGTLVTAPAQAGRPEAGLQQAGPQQAGPQQAGEQPALNGHAPAQ